MTALQRRAHALEQRFMHDEEFMFRAQARRNAEIGRWAASLLGDADGDRYAQKLIEADVSHAGGAHAQLRSDFDAAGIAIDDGEIFDRMMQTLRATAQQMFDGR